MFGVDLKFEDSPVQRVEGICASLVGLAVLTVIVSLPSIAMSNSFNAVDCGSSFPEYSINWWAGGDSGTFEIQSNPNCSATSTDDCPQYINFINRHMMFVANWHVDKVDFKFTSNFELEGGYDYLRLRGAINQGTQRNVTGHHSTPFWETYDGEGQTLEQNPAEWVLDTDYSVTDEGFYMSKVRIHCGTHTHQPTYLNNTTYDKQPWEFRGALLGDKDVIHVMFDQDSNTNPDTVVLDASGSHDFDLYAKCGQEPTTSDYDGRGFSADSNEYMHLEGYQCDSDQRWYVAIHSYSGEGTFRIGIHQHTPEVHNDITAGVEWNASSSEMDTIENTLDEGARFYYAALEGAHIVDEIYLYNDADSDCSNCGGSNCDVCFKDQSGTATYQASEQQIEMYNGYRDEHRGFAHELGHAGGFSAGAGVVALGDEYENHTSGDIEQCGHTIMALQQTNHTRNICYHAGSSTDSHDHKEDKNPNASSTSLSSGRDQLDSHGHYTYESDSDSRTYSNYGFGRNGQEFNGHICEVIRK